MNQDEVEICYVMPTSPRGETIPFNQLRKDYFQRLFTQQLFELIIFLLEGNTSLVRFRPAQSVRSSFEKVRFPAVNQIFSNAMLTSELGNAPIASEGRQDDGLLLLCRPRFTLLNHDCLHDEGLLFSAHRGRSCQGFTGSSPPFLCIKKQH